MSVKSLVVAFDGSPHSFKALEWAADFATQTAASLAVVTVFEPVQHYALDTVVHIVHLESTYKTKLEECLKEASDYCLKKGLNVKTELRLGHPADEIIRFSQEEKADLILCGTRALSGLGSLLLGSVAQKLVSYSSLPVLVVK